jgi:Zn-dependent protease with chaperone function
MAMKRRILSLAGALGLAAMAVPAAAEVKQEKVDGYVEWRQGDLLVIDGQRVRLARGGKFKGRGEAASLESLPLGYEAKAKGVRGADGVLQAVELEARPNNSALFEKDVIKLTNQAESEYRRAGSFFQEAAGGRVQSIGRLEEDGPRVERVRGIVDALLPPYLDHDAVRVYVIDNDEWNAFAMGNYSIYVFSGLLRDMDDDEVAIVLGHELAHATHEHTRRQFKKAMWVQLVAVGLMGAEEQIDDKKARVLAQLLTAFGAMAWSNGYGRNLEDQADRVGLRYAYEAGFDITKGPRLWNRFAKKYGQPGKVANFFFGNHSLSSQRAVALERELALNYADGPKEGGPQYARVPSRDAGRAARSSQSPATAPDVTEALAATSPSSSSSSSGSKEIKPGMTADQVRRVLGAPSEEVAFGGQTKWVYPELSVIFESGKVKSVKF